METNSLGIVLQLVVSCIIGILMGRCFLWGFPYVIKKNEMKVVKGGGVQKTAFMVLSLIE